MSIEVKNNAVRIKDEELFLRYPNILEMQTNPAYPTSPAAYSTMLVFDNPEIEEAIKTAAQSTFDYKQTPDKLRKKIMLDYIHEGNDVKVKEYKNNEPTGNYVTPEALIDKKFIRARANKHIPVLAVHPETKETIPLVDEELGYIGTDPIDKSPYVYSGVKASVDIVFVNVKDKLVAYLQRVKVFPTTLKEFEATAAFNDDDF